LAEPRGPTRSTVKEPENRRDDYEVVVWAKSRHRRHATSAPGVSDGGIAEFIRKLTDLVGDPTSTLPAVAWPLPLSGHGARFAAGTTPQAAERKQQLAA